MHTPPATPVMPAGPAAGRFPLAGAALVAGLVAMQFFDMRTLLASNPWCSGFLLGFAAVALGCLPALLRRSSWSRAGGLVLGSFALLLAWALLRAVETPLPRLLRPRVAVGREYLVIPVVTAAVTAAAGWGLACAVPARQRPRVLWWASQLLVVTSFLGWARTGLATRQLRLATGMGGAAVYHLVVLLALGILLAAAVEGRRRRASLLGAGGAALAVVLTGSRAGLIGLGLLALLLVLALAPRTGSRRQPTRGGVLLASGGVLVLAGLLALFPPARRLLQTNDFARQQNLQTAWRIVTQDPHTFLLGVGSGRMWPWYAFETGLAPQPWRNIVVNNFGRVTTNPHSVLLGVLVELGLLGLVPLLVMVVVLLRRAVLAWRSAGHAEGSGAGTAARGRLVRLLAVVCTLPAFALDTYLFKNFAVSFWWWFVVACVLAPVAPREPFERIDA